MTDDPHVSGHQDPEGEAPWAMQLVVAADKELEATHEDVCAATARAVVALLADPRATAGAWSTAVARWEAGRIRKVTRRARGARWEAALACDGLTTTTGNVGVHALVPGPIDTVPAEVRRLQVSGLDLPRQERTGTHVLGTLLICLNPDVPMTTGKAAAQAGHAAQVAWLQLSGAKLERWAQAGFPVGVTTARDAWQAGTAESAVAIRDAGFTEVEPGTLTATAVWIPQ